MRLATDKAPTQTKSKAVGSASAVTNKPSATNENVRPANHAIESSSPQHSALAARATLDAIRDWDLNSGALLWPQGLTVLLGYAPAAVPETIAFWQQNLHPEDRARVAQEINAALRGDAENWSGEYRFRRADETYAHLLERALIVRDEKGKAQRLVGSLMDITARKQLQDQIFRSQKMEAFGRLAAGVAHDFNNFLTTILGYSDLVLGELPAKNKCAKHVTEIQHAAGRASSLTNQLLAFSRKHPLEPRVVEVNALVTNLELSLLRLLGENISVVCHLHPDPKGLHLRVDPEQLVQILLNLAVNGRDAMPDGGILTVTTAETTIGQDELDASAEQIKPGDYVEINVADTGVGMSDEAKKHLFEPFFTTKDEGCGSGLGLATSYGIIRQSGGTIRMESEPNRGTIATVLLPKAETPPPPSRRRSKMPTGTETILVLEDDISVRHISVRVLRNLGYDVIEAATGSDAQELFSQDGDRQIHLLLTDVVMPQMSGHNFAHWLKTESPETIVIFVSGYLQEAVPGLESDLYFLPKPFTPEQLADKVRAALDSHAKS